METSADVKTYLKKIGSKGGKKSSKHPARKYLNSKAARARWSKYRKEAYSIMAMQVKAGARRRPKDSYCEVCGVVGAHKHHEDYKDPFTIRYLCPKHHQQRHKELRALKKNPK